MTMGGVSISFPSFDEPGASSRSYTSSKGNVVVENYTTGLSQVHFFESGDVVNTSSDTQIAAKHLLVETDDASWSRGVDRTLKLRITPNVPGSFTAKVRGWICASGYTDCSRGPSNGITTDQQGWKAELLTFKVVGNTESANLEPYALSVPSTAEPGEKIVVKWTVKNSGGADVGSTTNSIRLQGQGIDEELGKHNNDALSKGSSTHGHNPEFQLPRDLKAGSYQLVVQVDPDNKVSESNENDNTISQTLEIKAGTPANLEPYALSVPVTAEPGEEIKVRWTVKNSGGADVGSTSNSIRLQGQGIDEELGKHNNDALSKGSSTHGHNPDFRLPRNLKAGSYQLVVQVDPDNKVSESNENDNTVSQTLLVSPFGLPPDSFKIQAKNFITIYDFAAVPGHGYFQLQVKYPQDQESNVIGLSLFRPSISTPDNTVIREVFPLDDKSSFVGDFAITLTSGVVGTGAGLACASISGPFAPVAGPTCAIAVGSATSLLLTSLVDELDSIKFEPHYFFVDTINPGTVVNFIVWISTTDGSTPRIPQVCVYYGGTSNPTESFDCPISLG